jgi:outer membrane protein TolC
MRVLITIVISFLYVSNIQAQDSLSFETYKMLVFKNHPVVSKAMNMQELGNAEKLKAKGAFDPSVSSNIGQKQMDGKEYYWMSNTSLKIPTWVGANLKTGYEANRGNYLNNDMYVPSSGLWYMGVEIPLGQGLFYDERRLQLQQAKNLQQMGVLERQIVLNDLLLDAYSSYWLWTEAYRKFLIADEGFQLATQRYEAVKSQVSTGDTPPIDTIEARILLENRTIDRLQAKNNLANTKLLASTFIWNDSLQPIFIPENVRPQKKMDPSVTFVSNPSDRVDTLPIVQQAFYKIEQMELELKWKREQLKPTVNVNYNLLAKPIGDQSLAPVTMQNYKVGVTGYIPLFLRKERGGFKQSKLKLENANLDYSVKKREYQVKIQTMQNELIQVQTALETQKRLVEHTRKLRDAELIHFEMGESSQFLVNTREQNYLSAENKLVEIEIKTMVTSLKMKWLMNELTKF